MTPFRQLIRPGQTGGDVLAVKRAYVRMGVRGSGALAMTRSAGHAFVRCTERVQRNHGLHADGVYGKHTHAVVAPHFDARSVFLYRTAQIRRPTPPPVPAGSAQALAQRLLQLQVEGRYHADNPGDLHDLQATAAGRAVWSQGGFWVHISARPLEALVWLIEQGHRIGTFAICSDHGNDGPRGHAGGHAVDISSIDGVSVASHASRAQTLAVAQRLHTGPLRPWQLICDGYGNIHDPAISALTIPSAAFYGWTTMAAHRNHLHAGYL